MTMNLAFKPLLSVAPILLAAVPLAGCDGTLNSPPVEQRVPPSEDSNASGEIVSGTDNMAGSEQTHDGERSYTEATSTPLGDQAKEGGFICGGETSRASVDMYFANLQSALLENESNRKLSAFVAAKAETISRDEWQEISDRGAAGLKDAGWRGCFMDNGKVWFQADMENGLKLSSISRSMPWVGTAEK